MISVPRTAAWRQATAPTAAHCSRRTAAKTCASFADIEDRFEPALPVDDMERSVVHEPTSAIRDHDDAEGFEQGVESQLVLRARCNPETSVRAMRLRIVLERFGPVARRVEADADEPDAV